MLQRLKREIKKYLYFYGLRLLAPIGLGFLIVGWIAICQRPIKTQYNQEKVVKNLETESTIDVVFHYYLDFSPSMWGFFNEDINSNMVNLAQVLKKINESSNQQNFFQCADEITGIDKDVFYKNMTKSSNLSDYYNEFIYNYDSQNRQNIGLPTAIENICLKDLFDKQYVNGQSYNSGKDSLNVIISDLNFKKNEQDSEESNSLQEFAALLGKNVDKSNISIYCINSNFAGIKTDNYDMGSVENQSVTQNSFFVIVLSSNNTVYSTFTSDLENELKNQNVGNFNKYELLNNIIDSQQNMVIDIENLKKLSLIKEKVNFNYDNASFSNLDSNEVGFRLVRDQGYAKLNMCVMPIQIKGYYDSEDEEVIDKTQINVISKVSYPVGKSYKEYVGDDVIKGINAGLSWEINQLYLKFNIEVNTNVPFEKPEKIWNFQEVYKQDYFIIELQFYLEMPYYTIPEWVTSNEELQDKQVIFTSIAEQKQKTFSDENTDCYIGTVNLYITY